MSFIPGIAQSRSEQSDRRDVPGGRGQGARDGTGSRRSSGSKSRRLESRRPLREVSMELEPRVRPAEPMALRAVDGGFRASILHPRSPTKPAFAGGYAFVLAERMDQAVSTLCRVTGANRHGFSAWLHGAPVRDRHRSFGTIKSLLRLANFASRPERYQEARRRCLGWTNLTADQREQHGQAMPTTSEPPPASERVRARRPRVI